MVLGFKDFGDTDNGDGFYFMDPPNLQPSPPQKKNETQAPRKT